MQEVMRQKAGGDYYAGKLRHTMMILNSKKNVLFAGLKIQDKI